MNDMRKLMEKVNKINEGPKPQYVEPKEGRMYNPVTYKIATMKADGTCTGCGRILEKHVDYLGKDGGYEGKPWRLCEPCVLAIQSI
jgi:CRISPR/Cas system-associated protein Cas10 (large subunit of type III CRISPR-Cas system)